MKHGWAEVEAGKQKDSCCSYRLNACVPAKFICWNPIPIVMVLGGGTFGRWLVQRVEPSWMGLVPLWKRPQRIPSPLLPCEDKAWRRPSMYQEEDPPRYWICCHLDPGLLASRKVRKRFLLFISSQSMVFCCNSLNRLWQLQMSPDLWRFDLQYFDFMMVQKQSRKHTSSFEFWSFPQAGDRWPDPLLWCWATAATASSQPKVTRGNSQHACRHRQLFWRQTTILFFTSSTVFDKRHQVFNTLL